MADSMSVTNENNNNNNNNTDDSISEDSGWSFYIDNDSATAAADSSSIACSSSSFGFSFGFSSEPECSAVYHVVSAARHVQQPLAKRRKNEIDHELEDTATSPLSTSKVQESENLGMKFRGTDDDDLSGELDYDGYSKDKRSTTVNQISEEVMTTQSNFDWKEMSYTKLREKGLCLVPVSMLFSLQ